MKYLIFVIIVSACAGTPRPSPDTHTFRHGIIPIENSARNKRINARLLEASVQRGKTLFTQNCASCHGEDGKGGKKVPDLSALVKEVPNFNFFLSISQWSGQMPGWKEKYSEADREDLVNYIKTFR